MNNINNSTFCELFLKANLFLDFNRIQRELVLKNSPIIILLINDKLYVYVYGVPVIVELLNLSNYHIIKSVTHYVLYKTLTGDNVEIIEPEITDSLKDLKIVHSDIDVSKLLLETLNCPQKVNYNLIMKVCAEMYSSELHRAVQSIKNTLFNLLSIDDWNQMIVCVSGPPSPRPGHSAIQYFERLTGSVVGDEFSPSLSESEQTIKKNRRLYYIENVYECEKVLEIMAQLEVERNIFDRIVPMKTDIMAYDTKEYLNKVCCKK